MGRTMVLAISLTEEEKKAKEIAEEIYVKLKELIEDKHGLELSMANGGQVWEEAVYTNGKIQATVGIREHPAIQKVKYEIYIILEPAT